MHMTLHVGGKLVKNCLSNFFPPAPALLPLPPFPPPPFFLEILLKIVNETEKNRFSFGFFRPVL